MNLVNGKPSSSISIFDRGFLYGDSVFETILVLDKKPKNIDLHLKRLKLGCNKLKINNLDYKLLSKYIKKALSDINNCILSINVTRGTAIKRGYNINLANNPNIIITTSKIPKYPKEFSTKGIKTKFSKTNLMNNERLSQIKHSNRIEQILASKEITKSFPELILCDPKDFVVEGISSNIFFVKNKNFYTPLIRESGVEGIMKSLIIKNIKKRRFKIIEKKIHKKEVFNYDAAFFCNSIRLAWNILSVDGKKYKGNKFATEIIRITNNE